MKSFARAVWVAPACAGLFLLACVTINIYFPAEKVESVAGEIVKDIRGKKEGEKKPTGPEKDSFLQRTLYALTSPATVWAQEVTTVSNPTIRALKERMKARYPKMKPYYQKGILKEGDNGYVFLAEAPRLSLKEKRSVRGLMSAENADRKVLYQEVAKALKIDPSQVDRVAGIFAKEWQKSVR